MLVPSRLLVVVCILMPALGLALERRSPPVGTSISASFRCDTGPEALIDGDEATFMQAGGGTDTGGPTSVFLRFPQPLTDLSGVITGDSDQYHNYYPQVMEFWADSNGDGRYDTRLGRTDRLGPAAECRGEHAFDGRLPQVHGLELRVTKQHSGGGKRAWTMNEIRLLHKQDLPTIAATPSAHRVSYFTQAIPAGTIARSSKATEPGKGAELLLDGDADSVMTHQGGTYRKGEPTSVFLTFPQPVADLAGLVFGRGDQFGNYRWKEMEVHADTTGDGTYDTRIGRLSGGTGRKTFDPASKPAHGLELRVTDQTNAGGGRAFALSEVEALVIADRLGSGEMRYVIEDFEDFASWRTWGTGTAQPEGERFYGEHAWLCGVRDPARAFAGQGVGEFRYILKDDAKARRQWATRGKVKDQEAAIDRIVFQADPQGAETRLWFEIVDAKGKNAQTPKVTLQGSGWREYTVDCTPAALPAAGAMEAPMYVAMIFIERDEGGTGDILLDDITLVGAVDRSKRVRIDAIYEGIAYDPASAVRPRYRLHNALDRAISAPLRGRLYSSFDPKHTQVLGEAIRSVTIPAYGNVEVALDFGQLPYGHYELDLAFDAEGVVARSTDQIAVFVPNGERINHSPMWFGSQHHGSWTARPENAFRFEQFVVALGLDCYRTGEPGEFVREHGLLAAAGFGGMPRRLRRKGQENDGRGAPNDYDAYYEWVKQEAREKYLPYADKILSVEFYNEPDLPDFVYLPEIDEFLKMHDHFARAFREVIPGIRIGTGSVTVGHSKEKKDFTPRMFLEADYDVAVWHAHGGLANYVTRHRQVERYLEQKGVPREEWRLGNSEAAAVSWHDAGGRLDQAVKLVQKIGWAKAQASSEFFTWFVTGDVIDPQWPRRREENWGLFDADQRTKPSGQAYNELIRQLANTEGLGDADFGEQVQGLAYRTTDGEERVWLVWPQDIGERFLLPLAATAPVRVIDMFGRASELAPVGGRITLPIEGYPLYLRAPAAVELTPAAGPEWADVPRSIAGAPGETATLALELRSPSGRAGELQLVLSDLDGTELASGRVAVPASGSAPAELAVAVPAAAAFGGRGCVLRLSGLGADETVPLSLVVADRVPKVATSFAIDGAVDALPAATEIMLAGKDHVQDLVFDPSTPYWADAADLSLRTTLAHDGAGLYLAFTVRDQTHVPGDASSKLWAKDSIQIAFFADGQHSEYGFTAAEGGYGFCFAHGDPAKVGQPLTQPVAARRGDGATTYEVYLPFADLGLSYRPGKVLRCTFLANEDDGRGRVRIMRWFDGIASGKNVEQFGYLVLE